MNRETPEINLLGVFHIVKYLVQGNEMLARIENTLSVVPFDKYTVHFHRRKIDKQYEIIARMKQREEGDFYQDGDFHGSWVTLSVVPTHAEALEEIKRLRQ